MAGLKKRKLIITISIFFIVVYWIILYPLLRDIDNIDLFKLVDILFLNFSEFAFFNLNKFNPQFLILFVFMFYIMYHQQISVVSENTSFLSMVIHKRQKYDIIKMIMLESMKDNFVIFSTSILSILITNTISNIIFGGISGFNIMQIIKTIIYLIRYLMCVFSMVSLVRIKELMKVGSYDLVIPYIIIIVFMMVDFVLGTSLITISSGLISEIIYLVIVLVISIIAFIITKNKVNNSKEVCND